MAKQISDVLRAAPTPATLANLFITRRNAFAWLALLLVVLAILRSAVAIRLDGFGVHPARIYPRSTHCETLTWSEFFG
ncbi:MAG TPA: hypothetical protein VGI45_19155 [Terracidiphilus sp.]|jgi:hypothetical protein